MISRRLITPQQNIWQTAYNARLWIKIGVGILLCGGLGLMLPTAIDWVPPLSNPDIPPPPVQTADTTELAALYDPFPFPLELATQVDFWKKIFTQYTSKQLVIHDDWYVNVVYEVVDIGSAEFASEKDGREAARKAKERYETVLANLSEHWGQAAKMSATEEQVYNMFQGFPELPGFKKRDAKDRVHIQGGQKDLFQTGIIGAGKYLPTMKQIFREHRLPEKLVFLPLIESAFNSHASSNVGAAGMWQFMRGTGKEYDLTINSVVDERKDPLRATRAAARLLAHNYEVTQSWPLAITAYNFGLQGIKNAARDLGSDKIEDLVRHYQGPRFGYASRNFYVEFLAAVDVCLRYMQYFGEIELDAPVELAHVKLADYVSAKTLAKYSKLSLAELQTLNPALHASVFRDGGFLPKNYALNIPKQHETGFRSWYAALPKSVKYAYLPVKTTHRVKKGQSLSVIANMYGTSVKAIMGANGIKNSRHIKIGQKLKIPGGYVALAAAHDSPAVSAKTTTAEVTPSATAKSTHTHQVRKGQTLSELAQEYHTSVNAILSHNGIHDPSKIKAGQTLKIPATASQAVAKSSKKTSTQAAQVKTKHRVKKGQTLASIAKLHKTSVKAIAKANAIKDPKKIKVGQLLKIPEG